MILWRASIRYLLRHPLQTIFAIIGVALGVAVVVAIDLANESARRAFRISAEAISGNATHQIVGGPDGVPEEFYRTLRVGGGIRRSAPIVEGYAEVPSHPGLTLQVLGIDPIADPLFRSYTPGPTTKTTFPRLLAEPATGLMLDSTAHRMGIYPGGVLTLRIGGVSHSLTLLDFIQPRDRVQRLALDTVVVTDIATAQELLGIVGRLSRIDLIVPEGSAGKAELERIKAILPPGAAVTRSGTRSDALEQMTRAFTLNLTALSLLALVVGMFLIYNTMTFSVVQRRQIIGTLRALGVTRREVFLLVLSEAFVIGAVGTALGMLLGVVLGNGLLHLVTGTINDLYFVLSVQQMAVAPLSVAKGIALGLGATLLSAAGPAYEATTSPPRAVLSRSVIETRLRKVVPLASLAGVVILLLGGGALLFPSQSLILGFGAMFAIIGGFALLTPALTVIMTRIMQTFMGTVFGILGKMSARGVVASLSRTGVATAALVIAISATIGVGIMIGSFRLTVIRWLENYLRADIYVTTAGIQAGPGKAPLDPALIERIAALPGVKNISLARRVFLESSAGTSELFVVQIPRTSFAGFQLKEGTGGSTWREFLEGAVIVSEPYAYHHNLHRGDTVRLRTQQGERDFTVAGVYYDYGSDRGRVTMSRKTYLKFWGDRSVDSLGIYQVPGSETDAVIKRIRERAASLQQVVVYSNRALREASIATFDRTFAITGILRLLAIVVAFVGVLSALMAMQLERARELAVLRANGLTPAQLWGLVSCETGLIGLIAGLLAIPLGVVQALVLILVINHRSFGWTMQLHVPSGVLIQAVGLALVAALLAGIYPSIRMARTPPALALREE